MIFVNFKTYKEGVGAKAVKLAKICREVSHSSKVPIFPVVQVVDLWQVKKELGDFPVWVQHVDPQPQGKQTGFVNLEAVLAGGASGTLLNHAEHRIPPGTINKTIQRTRKLSSNDGFKVMLNCKTMGQAERLVKFKPDYLAYEPPELIGDRESSVATAHPGTIAKLSKKFPQLPIIVGAGIHSQEDVAVSLGLGAKGVLVATDVVLAKDPKGELEDLAQGF